MLIIPAIDIINGKVTRLTKGDYSTAEFYSASPQEQAAAFKKRGFNRIHIIDLIGSRDAGFTALDIAADIKRDTGARIQFGGGARTFDDISLMFDKGIDYIITGSMSVRNKPEFEKAAAEYGPEKFIIAADSQNGMIRIKGWTEEGGVSVIEHIKYCRQLGIKTFLCTDIDKDGTGEGVNIPFYKSLMEKFPNSDFIASGGVSKLEELEKLKEMRMFAAVVGKAIYNGSIKLKELAEIAD